MTPLERIAHDIICIIKFGGVGGSANSRDIKRVVEYLNSVRPLPEQPKPVIALSIPKPKPVIVPPSAPKIILSPMIKLPSS